MIRIKLKKSQPLKTRKRLKNKARIRKKVFGTSECPRFSVFRSHKHIYVQIIDDEKGETLGSASSLGLKKEGSSLKQASKVGEVAAKKVLTKKINSVVFDRGGFIYHGRLKALAEGARSAGLKF